MNRLYRLAFELFPDSGLDSAKVHCMEDRNLNYGLHHEDLFSGNDVNELTLVQHGTKSLGIRYENERHVRLYSRERCPYSESNLQFLKTIALLVKYHYIHKQQKELRQGTSLYLRVNLVVGAKTAEHTDTMRGATPNFVLFEPNSNFALAVRLFPEFRCSVVIYDGNYFIPHTVSPKDGLCMIGRKGGGVHYYYFPYSAIEHLQPHGSLHGNIVVGIKQQKLQVIPMQYTTVDNSKTLELLSFDDALILAKENPQKLPRRRLRIIRNNNKMRIFWGWKHAHKYVPGSDHLCRRIHVFFRGMREETPTARVKDRKQKDGGTTAINYSDYVLGSKL